MHHVRLVYVGKTATLAKSVKGSYNKVWRKDIPFLARSLCSSNAKDKEGGDNNSETNDGKKNTVGGSKSSSAKAKLDSLLQSIVKENRDGLKKTEKIIDMKLAAPVREKKRKEDLKSLEEQDAEKNLGKEMVMAVKKVAETVEGDTKSVESELVQKLKTSVGKKINMMEVVAGMKIDRSAKATPSTSSVDADLSRAHRVRRLLNERSQGSQTQRDTPRMQERQRRTPPPSDMSYIPIDLFGAPPLGIFTDTKGSVEETPQPQTPMLETWDKLYAKDLKLSVTHPPANGFEEMILWTEQGKLWKFPIDNELGLEEEAKVPFHEHVFLEPQIEDWCPKKGPIRHFMELVCVGLSKNPFLTVKEKHEQIEWYHQYFKNKSAIIKEVGAGEIK